MVLILLTTAPGRGQGESERRLQGMRDELRRLRQELAGLSQSERGLLGELERLGGELRLRRAELESVEARLDEVETAIAQRGAELTRLEAEQDERRGYLAFRLREIYKAGPDQSLRRLVGGEEAAQYLDGLRYATYLSERDRKVLADYRESATRVERERSALEEQRADLAELRDELDGRRRELERARGARNRRLTELQEDQSQRRDAIAELEVASAELEGLIGSLAGERPGTGLDVRKFRGLLDWPSAGRVTSGFGNEIHPRFKTRIPHPGIDMAADFGDPIHAVFDGRVAFAAWMRGYGLTAIVDHGSGVLSVYAHASVLMVEPGERVGRNQRIGAVGDTGSLKGAYLYFELRVDGKPVNPVHWLRRR